MFDRRFFMDLLKIFPLLITLFGLFRLSAEILQQPSNNARDRHKLEMELKKLRPDYTSPSFFNEDEYQNLKKM